MNYSQVYSNIVSRAKSRPRPPIVESHHIIPKSIGGTDSEDNLVDLTPKEHFLCHLLLVKMYSGKEKQKMVFAIWAMMNLCNKHQHRKKIKGRLYESLRIEFLKSQKDRAGENHPLKGKKTGRTKEDFTDEWKAKISAAKKGKPGHSKGISRPDSVKNAVSKANKGRVPWNKGLKNFKEVSRLRKST